MTSTRTVLFLIVLTSLATTLPGCRSSKAEVNTNNVTTGQALQDLEDAKNKGLVSEDEYKKERKKILEHD
jgi:hypothetical protein